MEEQGGLEVVRQLKRQRCLFLNLSVQSLRPTLRKERAYAHKLPVIFARARALVYTHTQAHTLSICIFICVCAQTNLKNENAI